MQVLCHCIATGQVSNPEGFARLCDLAYRNVFPALVAVAVFTNALNTSVLAFLQHTSSPSPARVYLLWLAVNHCLACIPVLVALLKTGRASLSFGWAFYFAHIETPLYNGLNFVCVYVIIGLSLDRFTAVCGARKYSSALAFRRAYLTAVFAYLAAAVLYAPYGFYEHPQRISNTSDEWTLGEGRLIRKPVWVAWGLIVQAAHRIIPGIVLIVINVQIFCTLIRLSRLRRAGSGKGNAVRHRKDRQLLHLLLALTFAFLLTNIPSAVLQMSYTTKPAHCDIHMTEEVARAISNCLEMSSYCFDFFFYFLMNTEYRRGLVRIGRVLCGCLPQCKEVYNVPPEISVSRSGILK